MTSRINEAAAVIASAGLLGRRKALQDAVDALGDEHGFDCRSLKAPMSDKHGPCNCGAGRVRELLHAAKEPR